MSRRDDLRNNSHQQKIMTYDNELSLNQLQQISGGDLKNPYAKFLKPKAQKKLKPLKPLTLKDLMNGGACPGPYLPGPNYFNQQMMYSPNQWM